MLLGKGYKFKQLKAQRNQSEVEDEQSLLQCYYVIHSIQLNHFSAIWPL